MKVFIHNKEKINISKLFCCIAVFSWTKKVMTGVFN